MVSSLGVAGVFMLGALMAAVMIWGATTFSHSLDELWKDMTRPKREDPYKEGFQAGNRAARAEMETWMASYLEKEFNNHLKDIKRMFLMKLEVKPMNAYTMPPVEDETVKVIQARMSRHVEITRPKVGLHLLFSPNDGRPLVVPERYLNEMKEETNDA